MGIVNGYATLAQLKALLGITDTADDTLLEDAINAASRNIDGATGWPHGFWIDGSVATREFYADSQWCCYVPEGIATTTGLIVKLDTDADGTYETTLTIATDFLLAPLNAADNVPAWPYDEIRLVANYSMPMSHRGRPGVQVVAKFGWPAVPDDVTRACLLHARDLHKAKDLTGDVAGFGQFGPLRIAQMSRTVLGLLRPYTKASVG